MFYDYPGGGLFKTNRIVVINYIVLLLLLYEEFSGVSFLWLMPSVYFVWKDDEKGENVASRPTSPLPKWRKWRQAP